MNSKYDYYALLPLKDQWFHFPDSEVSMRRYQRLLKNGLLQQCRFDEERVGVDGAEMRVWFIKIGITQLGLAALKEYEATHPGIDDTASEATQNKRYKDPLKFFDRFGSNTILLIIGLCFIIFIIFMELQ